MTIGCSMHRNRANGSVRRALGKVFAIGAAAATVLCAVPQAQATDTIPWGRVDAKYAAGRHQPYGHGYTGEDILQWSPEKDEYARQLRARVSLQPRIDPDASTQKNPGLPADTQMFDLAGDYGNAFFGSYQDDNVFSQYLFNYWQYADYYASWHGQASQGVDENLYDTNKDWTQRWFEFGVLNLPNPAYTNAAHRNGVKSIGAIFFSDNDRGEQTYRDLLKDRRGDGTFPVADKLIEIAKYFGFDGYFINQESDVDSADIAGYKDFIRQLTDKGVYVQWYDSAIDGTGKVDYQNEFNAKDSPWVNDAAKGKIADSIFLNYWYHGDMLKDSADYARSLGLDPKQSVFAGIEAGDHKFDTIDKNAQYMKVNLDASGKPYTSLAALGSDFVLHDIGDDKKVDPTYQHEVFDRERRLWTGSSNGSGKDQQDGWEGYSSQIAERSAIEGPVFSTSFNTGHGLEWRDGGKVTSNQEWGNINLQDIPVTWQWWIDAQQGDDSPLQADFDYGTQYKAADRFDYRKLGGYEGGDSLVLSGKLSSDNTIRLFKTDLDVGVGTKVNLVYDKPSSDDSSLSVAVVFDNDESAVVPVNVANGSATGGWRTVTADLSQYAGRRVKTLGLTVGHGAQPINGYQINIGKLTFTDGANHTPAAPTGLTLDKLFEDTEAGKSTEASVSWTLGDFSTTKNYELYLNDTFIGGRYDDNLYIKSLPGRTGTLKLYAIGSDGSRSEPAQLQLGAPSVTGIRLDAARKGELTASWERSEHDADKTVTLKSADGSWRYSDNPYLAVQQIPAGQNSVTFADVPVDGSRYTLDIADSDGARATAEDAFLDKTIEPYPLCSVKWSDDGTQVTLARPQTQDWRFIYPSERWKENGKEKSEPIDAQYTYSQQTPPIGHGIVRGRTLPSSYTIAAKHGGDLYVSYEDYRGNVTAPVKIPNANEISSCSVPDSTQPDAKVSTLGLMGNGASANGKDAQTVHVKVKDSFGNPQVASPVAFGVPQGLSVAPSRQGDADSMRDTSHGGTMNVASASNGIADLPLVAQVAGKYTVTASVEGHAIGDGIVVEFKALPHQDIPAVPDLPPSNSLNQSSHGPDGHRGTQGVEKAQRHDSIGRTGANVVSVVIAAVVFAVLATGIVVFRRLKR